MELILISNTKLKIMLDESDMRKYHIGNESDCADSGTRKAIRSLLERARDQIGFNTEGEEIFVQLYTSKDGGCELFITKSNALPLPSAEGEIKGEKKSKKREGTHTKKPSDDSCALTPLKERLPDQRRQTFGKMIFSFESLSDVCAVCRILNQRQNGILSRAYRGTDNDYYLVLENVNMSAYSRLDSLTFILEYGRRERADHVNTYLCEHGRIICSERALETLSQF